MYSTPPHWWGVSFYNFPLSLPTRKQRTGAYEWNLLTIQSIVPRYYIPV